MIKKIYVVQMKVWNENYISVGIFSSKKKANKFMLRKSYLSMRMLWKILNPKQINHIETERYLRDEGEMV